MWPSLENENYDHIIGVAVGEGFTYYKGLKGEKVNNIIFQQKPRGFDHQEIDS